MSWKSIAKGLAIAGATYVAATNISNALFGTNFKTIGYSGPDSSNSDANLGDALSAADGVTGGMSMSPSAGDTMPGAPGSAPVNTAAGATAANNPQANINAAAGSGSAPAGAPQPQSMVSKIGGGLLSLAKSPGGGTLLGNAIQGLAAGKAQEAALKEKHHMEGAFTPDQFSGILSGTTTPVPSGYLERARRVGEFLNGGAQPTVGAPVTTPINRAGG